MRGVLNDVAFTANLPTLLALVDVLEADRSLEFASPVLSGLLPGAAGRDSAASECLDAGLCLSISSTRLPSLFGTWLQLLVFSSACARVDDAEGACCGCLPPLLRPSCAGCVSSSGLSRLSQNRLRAVSSSAPTPPICETEARLTRTLCMCPQSALEGKSAHTCRLQSSGRLAMTPSRTFQICFWSHFLTGFTFRGSHETGSNELTSKVKGSDSESESSPGPQALLYYFKLPGRSRLRSTNSRLRSCYGSRPRGGPA